MEFEQQQIRRHRRKRFEDEPIPGLDELLKGAKCKEPPRDEDPRDLYPDDPWPDINN